MDANQETSLQEVLVVFLSVLTLVKGSGDVDFSGMVQAPRKGSVIGNKRTVLNVARDGKTINTISMKLQVCSIYSFDPYEISK